MDPMPEWLSNVIAPLPTDSSDLRWAVETVATMWARGDRKKTLLWLRQAVETARGDGQDDRAGVLAHAVIEFERLPAPSTPPSGSQPSSQVQAQASSAPTPSSNAQRPRAPRSVPPTAPYRLDAVTKLVAPPDDAVLSALKRKDTDPDQPPVSSNERALDSNERPSPLESTVVMDEDVNEAVARAKSKTLDTRVAGLEPMRARRVAVRSGSGREFVVMLLEDDESVPSGTQEAILVAMRRTP